MPTPTPTPSARARGGAAAAAPVPLEVSSAPARALLAGLRIVVLLAAAVAQEGAPLGAQEAGEAPLAIDGLDPVLLQEGREVDGDPLLEVEHEGLRYRFATDRSRRAFVAEPGRHAAQEGGACARMGPGVDGQPDLFAIHDQRLYLFGTELCLETFLARPGDYLLAPLPELSPGRAELAEARSLLALAEGALSERRLRRLDGYRVVGRIERGASATTVEHWTSLGASFDGPVRRKSMVGGDVEVHAWDGERGVVSDRLGRHPSSRSDLLALLAEARVFDALTVLAGLDPASATAVVEAPEESGPTRLLRVELPSGLAETVAGSTEQVVLEIDRHSGRVTALRFRGRGPGGRAGWITRRFADFRQVAGLDVPFRREDTFEDADRPFRVFLVERVTAERLDAAALELGAGV